MNTKCHPLVVGSRIWGGRLFLSLLSLLLLASPASPQRLGITKGFKVLGENFDPPHDTQPRSLLQGATAQALEDGNQLLTGVTLETYKETGQRELLIKAPQCVYDRTARTASSPGPLSVQTADGKFYIEGEGFLWSQENSSLIISNKVRTTIAPELLKRPGTAATNRPPPSEKTGPIEIVAGYFEYLRESGMSTYRRDVHVSGTNQLNLTSQVLEIKLPVEPAGGEARTAVPTGLESIRAEKDVTVEYGGIQATGQVAIYSTPTGVMRVSGLPAWRIDQRQGSADELTIEQTKKIFRADGNAWFRTPAEGVSIAGMLTQTNELPRSTQRATNQFIEIRSDGYEFRTNWAVFNRDVRLKELAGDQVGGTMSCGLLSVSFKGTNELQTLSARTNVLIKDGTNWLSCGNALLTGSNGVLTATEAPSWGAGTRSGKGDLVRIDTRANEMLVRGNASIQLPARELAESGAFQLAATNATPATRFATNEFAQIFCEEYTLRRESARFQGGVYATHPQMNWTCEVLSVDLPRATGQKQTLVAERGVKFQLSGDAGRQVEGEAEKAVYTYGVQGSVTNDLLTLTGTPATLHSTNGMVRNATIIYDRVKNNLRTSGSYTISGTNKLEGTNVLRLPKTRLTR